MIIKNVKDLEIYQGSLNILPRLYLLLDRIPRSENDTVWQTKRAGKSIPALIAEGFAKRISTNY